MAITPYSKQEVYTKEVAPLLKKLDEICGLNKIPYFFTAAVENDDEQTTYDSHVRTAIPCGLELTDDKIITHLKVCAGIKFVSINEAPEIEL
jgi:hypothetical protein